MAVIGLLAVRRLRATCGWGPGSVLVELSVVEQRYRAVLAVLAGESVIEVAAQVGVSRQTVHSWLARYRDEGLGGLMDRSNRPEFCPHQSPVEVEAAVCELRREHPRWGSRRLAHELGRSGMVPVPSASTVYRILVRHGLVDAKARRRRREDYKRWERDAPMALWQLDIVGGVFLADGTEVKVVTGVDDHSRYCVIAQRACGPRAGRCAWPSPGPGALRSPRGSPHGQWQAVHGPVRPGWRGAVRSDLPGQRDRAPPHPARYADHHGQGRAVPSDPAPGPARGPRPFADLEDVQAALDDWVADDYNTRRPHRSLDMASPADRFAPVP